MHLELGEESVESAAQGQSLNEEMATVSTVVVLYLKY